MIMSVDEMIAAVNAVQCQFTEICATCFNVTQVCTSVLISTETTVLVLFSNSLFYSLYTI